MDYNLLILGYEKEWEFAYSCVEQMFLNLKENFQSLENVKTTALKFDNQDLPKADFVIAIIFHDTEFDFNFVKSKTEAKKIVTFIEVLFEDADHSFVFVPSNSKECTLIRFPFAEFLESKPKTRNLILVDHSWEAFLGTENDWTYRIEDWLEHVKDDYKIERLTRFQNEKIRDFETPLSIMGYKDYLSKTDNVESFIVTHRESYGYGIIDMIVRGTRVFSPPNLLPQFMIDELEIPIFHNQEELLALLKTEGTKDKRDSCTVYSEAVKIIDNKFREWLT